MYDFHTLLPAPSCVSCGNTIEEIGGRRITAQLAGSELLIGLFPDLAPL